MATNFKTDDSFLRKLAVGAAGTNATIDRLKQLGFTPIELERGSTGFKIWKTIKIKRVRVPDILCLRTGLRFESRGKTKCEISMSHSLSDPKRAWDAGMRDDDFVSIVVFEQGASSPVNLERVSPIHFVSVEHMRASFASGQVSITRPKGVEEGSEIRVVWPSASANQPSVVTGVEASRIRLKSLSGDGTQIIQLSRSKGRIRLAPQVEDGETVDTNRIVASVVPVQTTLDCPPPVSEAHFVEKLVSINLSERYAAAKAMRYRGYGVAKAALEVRMNDANEDIYVQLEAAAALAAYDNPGGWEFIENKLRGSVLTVPLETQLETVIVASEIPSERSERLLIEILQDTNRNPELRAGAAWGLGQFPSPSSATALADAFKSSPLQIRIEAARALLRIGTPQTSRLIELLRNDDPGKRDGIAWVLARTGGFNPGDLLGGADDDLRRWTSYIIGYGKEKFTEAQVESICSADPEVYFAASVLWQIVASWIDGMTEY